MADKKTQEDIYLTIVISLWNEEKRVEGCVNKLNKYIDSKPFKVQVIFSDDHSTDKTIEIVKKFADEFDHIEYLEPKEGQPKGKGAGLQRGFGAANGKYVMFTDCDLSTPIEELDKMLPFACDYDIVMGSRYIQEPRPYHPNYFKAVFRGIKSVFEVLIFGKAKDFNAEGEQTRFRQLVSRGGNLAFTVLLNQSYVDQRCGFKLYKNKVAKFLASLQTIPGWSFDTEYLVISQKYKLKTIEVPVKWVAENTEAKYTTMDSLKEFSQIFIMWKNILLGLYSKNKAKKKLGDLYDEYILNWD